jgi:signal peptidase I
MPNRALLRTVLTLAGRRGGALMVPLAVSACAPPASTAPARAEAPSAVVVSAPSFASLAPARTRLLLAARAETPLAHLEAGALDALIAGCGVQLRRDIERIEVALSEPAELRIDLSGSVSADAVRCVLEHWSERGLVGAIELEVAPLAHGVRVATRGALADGPGAPPALTRRFDELTHRFEAAAVADLAPGGAYELWFDAEGVLTLRAALRSAAQAETAVKWLEHAFAADSSGALAAIRATAEGPVLVARAPSLGVSQALSLRQSVLEAFKLPSGSMLPTLEVGDRVYALKGASVRKPARGDIVVFASPSEPSQAFAKRVIGLPGDRVQIDGYRVRVNGTALESELADPSYIAAGPDPVHGELWRESLGSHRYRVLRVAARASRDALDVTVEPNRVFLLGDNRDNSLDSRHFGSVPVESLKGRVAVIWASFGEGGVRWERFGLEPD